MLLFSACQVPASTQEVSQLPRLNVRALAIDPLKTSTIYAGTLERGLLRSTDGGGTWSTVGGLGARSVSAIALRSGALVVATDVGTFWSSDGGATWTAGTDRPSTSGESGLIFAPELGRYQQKVLPGGAVVNSFAADPFNPGAVYAATDRGVFKKTGRDWKDVSTGMPGSRVYALAPDPSKSGVIYALTSRGLFATPDEGANWSAVSSSRPPVQPESLAVDPAAPTVFFAGTERGVFKSTDSGQHWDAVSPSLAVPAVLALAVDPANHGTLYAGTLGSGVFKSNDGGSSWRPANMAGELVGALAVDPVNSGTVYAGTGARAELESLQGVFKSTNGGASWLPVNNGLSELVFGISALAVAGTHPPTIYACSFDLFRSVNGGARWTNVSHTEKRILTYTWYQNRLASLVHSVAIDPANPTLQYAGGRDEIHKSIDGGVTWNAGKLGTERFDVLSLAIDPSHPATVYAVTSAVVILPPGGTVFKSSDGGTTWAASGKGLAVARFNSVAVDGADTRVVYAGSMGAGLFKSSDAGASWVVTPALEGQNVFTLATTREGEVYAGTSNGIFKSQDRGETWTAVNNGLFAGNAVSAPPGGGKP
jgi:photosystem II stability/assembly factor-like uncharacterized protein